MSLAVLLSGPEGFDVPDGFTGDGQRALGITHAFGIFRLAAWPSPLMAGVLGSGRDATKVFVGWCTGKMFQSSPTAEGGRDPSRERSP